MKVLHLCIQSPYNDYWGYQENLLPKYQRKLGHDVTVITTNTMHKGTEIVTVDTADYTLADGQRIIRIDYVKYKPKRISDIFRYFRIYDILCSIRPDFIMVHSLGNLSVLQVRKYIRKVNPECKVVADNHLDYYNGKGLLSIRHLPHRIIYRVLNNIMQKYYKVVYGITPWRMQYMQDIFWIKKSKSRLLMMGADDERIDIANRDRISAEVRAKHNIEDDDFLIVSGGKIDKSKNIHILIDAINKLDSEKIKLIIFGAPTNDMREMLEAASKNPKIKSIGWIDADEVYNYFLAADLVVFPGTHSVMWEQACACEVPCVFKHWEGMHHVDFGGNCEFLYEDSAEEMAYVINNIILDKGKYNNMKKVAKQARKEFLYSEIAKRVINEGV